MKKLIFVNGTMGVGKTATCEKLLDILRPGVFLDGDWCWNMQPFTVNDETKEMVLNNISFLLNSFLKCSEYDYIIFCWVMHEEEILTDILDRLDTAEAKIFKFTLTAGKEALSKRISNDVAAGRREKDSLERSLERTALYDKMNTMKIDVSEISPERAARLIADLVNR